MIDTSCRPANLHNLHQTDLYMKHCSVHQAEWTVTLVYVVLSSHVVHHYVAVCCAGYWRGDGSSLSLFSFSFSISNIIQSEPVRVLQLESAIFQENYLKSKCYFFKMKKSLNHAWVTVGQSWIKLSGMHLNTVFWSFKYPNGCPDGCLCIIKSPTLQHLPYCFSHTCCLI